MSKYDPQEAFENACDGDSFKLLVKRGNDKTFPMLSEWKKDGALYKVIHLLNAGRDVEVWFKKVAANA